MPRMKDLMDKATVQVIKQVKKELYVPYCKHTHKPGDKCPFHCKPSPRFLAWQKEMEENKKRAAEYRRLQDPIERLGDAIFGVVK